MDTLHKSSLGYVVKVDEDKGIVEHIVNTYGIIDHVGDIIELGCFDDAKAEDVRVLNHHLSYALEHVLGHPISVKEVTKKDLPAKIVKDHPDATGGLSVVTQYNLDTPQGLNAFNLIKAGDIKEYSVGFRILEDEMKRIDDRNVRVIIKGQLLEYSPVIWGANPGTETVGVKTVQKMLGLSEDAVMQEVFESMTEAQRESWKSYFDGLSPKEEQTEEPVKKLVPPAVKRFPFRNAENAEDIMKAVAALILKGVDDDMLSEHMGQEIYKALAPIYTEDQIKAMSLSDVQSTIVTQFYRAFPDDQHNMYFVRSVYEDHVVFYNWYDPVPGRHYKVGFTVATGWNVKFEEEIEEGIMQFAKYAFDSGMELNFEIGPDDDDEEDKADPKTDPEPELPDLSALNDVEALLKEINE